MTDLLAIHLMSEHPDDAAAALENVDAADLAELMAGVPDKPALRVLQRLPPLTVTRCLERLPVRRAAGLLARLPTTTAVPLVQLLAAGPREEILSRLPLGINSALRLVQSFPVGSVGAVMDSRAFTLPADIGVEEALQRIRHSPQTALHRIFVLDRNHRLAGSVAVQDLLSARRKAPLQAIVQKDLPMVSAKTRLGAVEHHPAWTHDTLIAVTDRKGLFLGVLHQKDMVDALRDQGHDAGMAQGSRDTLLELTDLLWSGAAALLFPTRENRAPPPETRDEH
ncbi:hypothetical protein GCM10011348_27840 [Marinobacterium nitratireducens]|uniref:CBS domain-containing protein n=1 Tax=Marinobacterium nitratireducens TaxID=518897 RepID=A0A918DTT6_9GAMM|nr:CBS domain-containing protein [Marinobacterium nitratireducens]GGO83622.1 hypothetical protein GCM10011348_27840 [Marinobacterium nitratireducens]